MVSIIILTHNEEQDLPQCLNSVSWSDDVHVLDSGSTDNTVNIAQRFGATITTHAFESFGKQRNYALDHLRIKHDWILFLDADEVVTEKFKTALLLAIQNADSSVAGYYCCWKMILEGKWLRYCDNFPKWQFRVLKHGRARFTDFGHGQKESDLIGEAKYLDEPYLHYGFSKGWFHWIARHNKYSSQEARARMLNAPPFNQVFSTHSSTRNPALKSWLTKVPGWPLLRFTYTYIFRLGFLEGGPGFIYCLNMSYYEFLIQIKIREHKKAASLKQGDIKNLVSV